MVEKIILYYKNVNRVRCFYLFNSWMKSARNYFAWVVVIVFILGLFALMFHTEIQIVMDRLILVVASNKVVKLGNQIEFQIVAESVLTANCSELQRSIDDVESEIIRRDPNLRDMEKRGGEISRIEKQMRGLSPQDSLDDLKEKKGYYETIFRECVLMKDRWMRREVFDENSWEKIWWRLERVIDSGKNILESLKWFYERSEKYDIDRKLLEEMEKRDHKISKIYDLVKEYYLDDGIWFVDRKKREVLDRDLDLLVEDYEGHKARTNLFFKERIEQNQERIKNIWKGKTKSSFLLF